VGREGQREIKGHSPRTVIIRHICHGKEKISTLGNVVHAISDFIIWAFHDGTGDLYNLRLRSCPVPGATRMSQSTTPPSGVVPSPFFHEENGLFVGIALESIFYGALQSSFDSPVIVNLLPIGITALLYFLTIRNFYPRALKNSSQALWKLMGILTVQQVALLIAVTCNIQFCVLAFVYHRDFPGGPVAYQIRNSNVTPGYMSLASFSICNWLQDVILVCFAFGGLDVTADLLNSYIDS